MENIETFKKRVLNVLKKEHPKTDWESVMADCEKEIQYAYKTQEYVRKYGGVSPIRDCVQMLVYREKNARTTSPAARTAFDEKLIVLLAKKGWSGVSQKDLDLCWESGDKAEELVEPMLTLHRVRTNSADAFAAYKKEVFDLLWKDCPPNSKAHPKNRNNKYPQNQLKQEHATDLVEEKYRFLVAACFEDGDSAETCKEHIDHNEFFDNL